MERPSRETGRDENILEQVILGPGKPIAQVDRNEFCPDEARAMTNKIPVFNPEDGTMILELLQILFEERLFVKPEMKGSHNLWERHPLFVLFEKREDLPAHKKIFPQ